MVFDENLEMEWCSSKNSTFSETLQARCGQNIYNAGESSNSEECMNQALNNDHYGRIVDTSDETGDKVTNDQCLNFLRNPHSKASFSFGGFRTFIPKMKIVILVVGTR